jgi:DNA repair exonuclease SbcCD ATPase subunit
VGGDEVERARLQRKVEQAQSELRRKFGEAAVSQAAPDPRVAELEDKVRRLEAERDEALRRAAAAAAAVPKEAPAADPRLAEELERARRQIDQLQAEARRRAGGTVTSAPSGDLEAALRQLRDVERERDSLRGMVAQGGGPARVPSRVLECLNAVGDGLADMRAALKAAGDELAVEQLEQARGNLKEILSLLGPR